MKSWEQSQKQWERKGDTVNGWEILCIDGENCEQREENCEQKDNV